MSPANQESAEFYCSDLKKKIEEEGILLDNVYNADETGVNYRSLTETTLGSHSESSAGENEESKERCTALFCINATGSHKLPLFCIGDSTKPRDLENEKLPIRYKGRKGAWMNRDLFLEWYVFFSSRR